MATILGVSALYHDAAATVVRGGEIIAAAQEERFSRRKHEPRFPVAAIAYCVAAAGGPDAIDAVAYCEDPVLALWATARFSPMRGDRTVKATSTCASSSARTGGRLRPSCWPNVRANSSN